MARAAHRSTHSSGRTRLKANRPRRGLDPAPRSATLFFLMSYRRSISTLGCPDLSLAETIALAQRHHLDAVELRALAQSIDLPTVFTTAYGTPTALAAWMKTAAVPIVSLDTSLKLADNSAADREDFLRSELLVSNV